MTDNNDNYGLRGSFVREDSSNFPKEDFPKEDTVSPRNASSPLITASASTEKCIDVISADNFMNSEQAITSEQATIVRGTVVARGTGEGLVLRLDGRVAKSALFISLVEYVESRKSFFSGQEVTLEWLESRPEEGVLSEVSALLQTRYQMIVKASRMFERNSKSAHTDIENLETLERSSSISMLKEVRTNLRPVGVNFGPSQIKTSQLNTKSTQFMPSGETGSNWSAEPNWTSEPNWQGESSSLFDGINAVNKYEGLKQTALNTAGSLSNAKSNLFQRKVDMQGFNAPDSKGAVSEALLWDEPDARIIRETLRGGQKIESEHSVIIKGDVNSGAEIVAGGDIFVLGRLRGVAHAGAYDESGAGRMIFALQMQPTQLRIGSIISQGSDENGRVPETAKIEGNMIVVEPYGISSTNSGSKKTAR